jgi:hypothetical protein
VDVNISRLQTATTQHIISDLVGGPASDLISKMSVKIFQIVVHIFPACLFVLVSIVPGHQPLANKGGFRLWRQSNCQKKSPGELLCLDGRGGECNLHP